jgi:hypothetical protein
MFLAKRVLEEEENVTILKVDDLQRVFLLWMFRCLLKRENFRVDYVAFLSKMIDF